MKKMLMLLCGALLINFSVQAAGDAEAGKSKSAKCVACHGMNGKITIPTYPNLAGQTRRIWNTRCWPIRKASAPAVWLT